MAQTISDQFLLAVKAGLVPGHRLISKFGHNESVGTAIEDIWEPGGLYPYLSAATVMTISSSDVDDTSAGTGARTVELFGLDENYKEVSELITLNGQNGVSTANSYLRVIRMIVRSAGSSGYNEGSLYLGTGTITTGVPAVIHMQVEFTAAGLGENQTNFALYTIPVGHTGLIMNVNFSNPQAKSAEVYIKVRPFGEVFQTKYRDMVWQANHLIDNNRVVYVAREKSDIRASAYTSSTTTDMTASFQILLLNNRQVPGLG